MLQMSRSWTMLRSHRGPAQPCSRKRRSPLRLERLEDRTLLSAGDLDPTFGMGGKVTSDFQGNLSTYGNALALQADGKIVVAGTTAAGTLTNRGFLLARYNVNGSLDSTFGAGGMVTTIFARLGPNGGAATAVVVQSDGRIIAAGYFDIGSITELALARYNGDGSLDATFGSGGVVTRHFADNEIMGAMALQSDGKLLVSGTLNYSTTPTAFLARFNADGSLDSSFGTGGSVTSAFGGGGIVVQTDGRIIAVGNGAVLRYDANGTLDTTFGNGGQVTNPPGSNMGPVAVVLQADGKIVVGQAGGIPLETVVFGALARYNADGTPDPTFGSGGTISTGPIASVGLQSNGDIISAGAVAELANQISLGRWTPSGALDANFTPNGGALTLLPGAMSMVVQPDDRVLVLAGDSTLARVNADGTPDASFGAGGQEGLAAYTGPVAAELSAVLIQPDGKIVVAGNEVGLSFALTRYNPDGTLDTTFGNGGKVTTGTYGFQPSAVLQPDGKIILVAWTGATSGGGQPAPMARYNADGSLDTTFGINGLGSVDFAAMTPFVELAYSFAQQVALQPDGKILVAGKFLGSIYHNQVLSLVRLNADGSVDTSFAAKFPNLLTYIGNANTEGLSLQPDGRIVLSVDETDPNGMTVYALLRFQPNGSLDPTFGRGGTVMTDFSGGVHLEADGRIVVVGPTPGQGSSGNSITMARYFPNGNPDTTFGTGGKVLANFGASGGSPSDFVLQPDGKILVAGRAAGGFALARFDPNGIVDTSFGIAGIATADLSDNSGAPVSVALQSDGRIVLAGRTSIAQPPEFGLARFLGTPPITDLNQRFVTHLYLDLLERSPDPSGLMTYTTALDQGQLTRTQVTFAITNSVEYRTLVVQGLYGRVLGRPADPAGLTNWVQFLNQGGTADQLEAILIGSAEYFSGRGGGTANGLLQALYGDVLGRAVDTSGSQTWGNALANGLSPTAVATTILASQESHQITVAELYAQVLHRPADASGLRTYTSLLQQGETETLVLAILASSDEYFARA
jgi:uncharacterized delta-60 repeat protein